MAGVGDLVGLPLAALGAASPSAFVTGLGAGSVSLLRNLSGAPSAARHPDSLSRRVEHALGCLVVSAPVPAKLATVFYRRSTLSRAQDGPSDTTQGRPRISHRHLPPHSGLKSRPPPKPSCLDIADDDSTCGHWSQGGR